VPDGADLSVWECYAVAPSIPHLTESAGRTVGFPTARPSEVASLRKDKKAANNKLRGRFAHLRTAGAR